MGTIYFTTRSIKLYLLKLKAFSLYEVQIDKSIYIIEMIYKIAIL